jgi:hypothetical protein
MDHPSLKICAALVLGAVLLAAPAYAVSPLSLDNSPSLLLAVEDVENEEVWRDLRPDITPPEAAVGKEQEAPKHEVKPEQPKEEAKASGEIEEKEMKEDGLDVPE